MISDLVLKIRLLLMVGMFILLLNGCETNYERGTIAIINNIPVGKKFIPENYTDQNINILLINSTKEYNKYSIRFYDGSCFSNIRYIYRRNSDSIIVSIYTISK